jgi:hypothetical protein
MDTQRTGYFSYCTVSNPLPLLIIGFGNSDTKITFAEI